VNSLKEAALRYADNGWMVFPLYGIVNGRCECGLACGSPGKHPRVSNGLYAASLDQEQVARWWDKWPAANIGVRTGRESGILVLDLDNKRSVDLGNGELIGEGAHSLRVESIRSGSLPDTLTSLTGSGGTHLIYTYPTESMTETSSYSNRTGILPSVDIRGDGGYIVVPPSLHQSGQRYQWVNEGQSPTSLPSTWQELCQRQTPTSFQLSLEPEQGLTVREGEGRHDWLFRIGSKLRGQNGLPAVALYGALQAYNRKVLVPPLEAKEVEHIVESCLRYEPGIPPPPLDTGELGDDIPELREGEDLATTFADFMMEEPEPFVPLVSGLLHSAEVMIVGGQPTVGKTWIVMDMMMGIASGTTFANNFPCEQANVLFIDEEGSRRGTWERYHMLLEGRDASWTDFPIWTKVGAGMRVDEPRGIVALTRLIEQYRPGVVVLDSLVRMHGRDESNNREMANFFDGVKKIRDNYGTSLVFTHHVRKPMANAENDPVWMMRGAGDIQGFPDSVLVFLPADAKNEMRAIHTKMRNGEKLNPFLLNMQIDPASKRARIGYLGEDVYISSTKKLRRDIVEAIRANGNIANTGHIAGALGVGTRAVKDHLDVLLATGEVVAKDVMGVTWYQLPMREEDYG
jgi:hypothetical protein